MSRPAPDIKTTPEPVTDKATASFVRRVLCSHQTHTTASTHGRSDEPPPIQDLLPPLTSSNDIDLQLYAFIAILIREYVHTWYTRITPDHVFVSEVVLVIAHCTRALEERARSVDFEALIFDDIAGLLDAHVQAYRVATRAANVPGPSSNPRLIYHTLRPHPALAPFADAKDEILQLQQQRNYSVYRTLLAQGILAVLLPTDDLQNPCLRALVSEVTADLIIGNFIGNRICESAFLYGSIAKASMTAQARLGTLSWAFDKTQPPKSQSRLAHFGLLADRQPLHSASHPQSAFSKALSTLAQCALLAFGVIRVLVQTLLSSSSLPARTLHLPAPGRSSQSPSASPVTPSYPPALVINAGSIAKSTPIVEYRAWAAGSRLMSLPLRMPWLSGIISLIQLFLTLGPGRLGETNRPLDRLLAHYLLSPLFPLSKYLPSILLNLRLALFPNNTIPPSNPLLANDDLAARDASHAELETTAKRAAAFAILNLIPRPVARVYFASAPAASASPSPAANDKPDNTPPGTTTTTTGLAASEQAETGDAELEVMVAGVEDALDVFGDAYMNRHLVFAVMERVVAALVPELAEGKSVAELLAERGVEVEGDVDADGIA